MKRFVFLLVAIAGLLPLFSSAQTKTLSIDDAVVGVWREYYPEMIYGLQIRPDTKTCTKWDGRNLVEFSFDQKKSSTLLTLEEIVTELKKNDIDIPDYFGLYNDLKALTKSSYFNPVRTQQINYANYVEAGRGAASECIGCKKCEKVCPQGLPIVDYLKDVVREFEEWTPADEGIGSDAAGFSSVVDA